MNYNYPYLEKFYKDNYSQLLSWESPLRPSKSCPKNGATGVQKFQNFYKKTGSNIFTEDEVLSILKADNVQDGDTIFHQNLRVMRELNFILPIGGKKYKFTNEFIDYINSGHSIECYLIEKLMSITTVGDFTMYFNFLICVMREAANYGQVIQYRDSASKFEADVPDENKRKEHQQRVYSIYGFKGDEARTVPENYTPNISYFCHAVLKQLGILEKSDIKIDNMGTLELTPLGELILKRIEENIEYGEQKITKKIILEKPLVDEPLQQIFYGAPGTGKSNTIKREVDEKKLPCIRTTFHPDSDYSTFVGAYKPTMETAESRVIPVVVNNGISLDQNQGTYTESKITYKFVKQAFMKAYLGAWKKYAERDGDEAVPQFLVIEEINRGNCAQIFGDLFQLLDRGGNGFSEYPIEADTDLQKEIERAFKEEKDGNDENPYKLVKDIEIEGVVDGYTSNYGATLSEDVQHGRVLLLPKNLYIWATMNTSDQSLFPIDSAFKRRWDWEYMPIGYKNDTWTIKIGTKEYNWVDFQRKINEKIYDVDNSEDKQLGDYFVNADRTGNEISSDTLLNKILFYLWNDVCKDDPDIIFKWVDDKDDNKENSIKFSDFFREEKERKLQGFMAFLGINANGDAEGKEEKNDDTTAGNDDVVNS